MLRFMLLGMVLLSSGAAGLINQVVWQRSLKLFLGGSEAVSSMIVVLVFMAGLGVGSIGMGRRAREFKNPLLALGFVEVLLFLVNLGVCAILRSNLSDSVFSFQTAAMLAGVPLALLYAVSAFGILAAPCLLMGATMPLAAEACQRQLLSANSRVLGLLFFINTTGSVAGALIASGYLIPNYGQSVSLLYAAVFNLAAGALSITLGLAGPAAPAAVSGEAVMPETERQPPSARRTVLRPTVEEILALGLGFCSLGYEMYLFRLVPLSHQPLPFTFAAVLAGFLFFWSLGAALSSTRMKLSVSAGLRICALACALTIALFAVDSGGTMTSAWTMAAFVILKFPYFVPCPLFGYLFGRVTEQSAESWGNDVGRIYAWNTLGSCLGILGMTLLGYEMPFFLMVFLIAFLLLALHEYARSQDRAMSSPRSRAVPKWAYPLALSVTTLLIGLSADLSRAIPGMRFFFGRDGVIGIDRAGNMVWDGLWHSALSNGNSHIGTNNWYVATCPVLAHRTGEIKDVCVIGVATGMTASTLSKLDSVERIDAYDFNRTLTKIYALYPQETLHLADNKKIHLIWQDARSGLALDHKKYDLIQTQPLYLKQAGSGLLNSLEFYQLVSRRLKPDGVFCLYSNGTPEQAFAVRQTAAQAFSYRASFMRGYLLILSNEPFEITEASLAKKLGRDDPLWEEIRGWKETRDATSILRLFDHPELPWGDGRLVITDDHPIVEYPDYLSARIKALGYTDELPRPGTGQTR